MSLEEWIELAGGVVDAAGVVVLVGGIAAVTVLVLVRRRSRHPAATYRRYRQASVG